MNSDKDKDNEKLEKLLKYYNNPESHLSAKPHKEAYLYFPKLNEQREIDPDTPEKVTRRIFEGNAEDNYTTQEKKYFEEIDLFIKNHDPKITFPDNWNNSNTYRYHQTTKYDCPKTVEKLLKHLKWKESVINEKLTDNIIDLLNTGCFYVHGRDSKFRPIIVFNIELLSELKNKYSQTEYETASFKFIDYIIENLLLPGQVENWVFIIYIGNAAVFSLKDQIIKIINTMQSNYPGRLFRSYILGLSTMMSYAWLIVKAFLSATTVKKFFVSKDSEWPTLHELINPNQIEKKFGGLAENVSGRYIFPPINISNEYLLKTDNLSEILIDEQKYLSIVSTDKRFEKCPFITEIKTTPTPILTPSSLTSNIMSNNKNVTKPKQVRMKSNNEESKNVMKNFSFKEEGK